MIDKPDWMTQEEYYEMTTNLLHFLVYNETTLKIKDDDDLKCELMSYYVRKVKKPACVEHYFAERPQKLKFSTFILSFLSNESKNVKYYISVNRNAKVELLKN